MTQIVIEAISNAEEPDRRTYHLLIEYSRGQARLELPVKAARSPEEQGTEACRRELLTLLEELQTATLHPQGIQWPYQGKS
ncbi:MAG: hypothetical protein Q7S99_00790 [Parvibaculum sp.]|nr:hypothetical protein [Parvibaculum sp.]